MDIKRTLAVSLIFHTCFLVTALILSINFAGEGGRKPYDNAMFVRLASHISEPDNKHIIETKKSNPSKFYRPPLLKAGNGNNSPPPPFSKGGIGGFSGEKLSVEKMDFQNEVVLNETTTENENNYGFNLYPESPGNVSSQGHGSMGIITANNPDSHPVPGEGITADNGKVLYRETIEIIRGLIEKAKVYPLAAKRRGIEGTVYVRFRINHDGKPEGLEILKSSGSGVLDEAALNIVKKAGLLPYVDVPLEVPVVFRLD